MNILVVPTIREDCIKGFLNAWQPHGFDHIIVIEDNPEKTFNIENVCHYSWKEIKKELGDKSWIISKRDSAIKCFGFYLAYKMGAKYIFALDDDCFPSSSFIQDHLESLVQPKWTEVVPGSRSRGVPYKNLGKMEIALNIGLWTGNPDLDSIQTLSGQKFEYEHRQKTRIVPSGQYIPMCGMNMCFKRETTPLMYFPLMGEGYTYRRFDDIWCGIIMKKVCDHLHWNVSIGDPEIVHLKASDPFVNLVKEAPGIATNEWFWEAIDEIELTEKTPVDCMREIGEKIPEKEGYLKKLGEAIQVWSSLFQSIE